MILRDYQSHIGDQVRACYRAGHRAVIIQLATGGGKTPTAAALIQAAVAKGKRVLVLAHRHELLTQLRDKLQLFDVPHGMISPHFTYQPHKPVQVASIQTMARREIELPFDLIVIDEAHLSVAPTYTKVIANYPRAYLLGLTATPVRLDGRGLGREYGGLYDAIVSGPSIEELTQTGNLVPMRVFTTLQPDTSHLRITAGEYNAKDVAALVDKPVITGDCVDHYLRLAKGRQALAFCCSIEHAKHTAAAFRSAGVEAVSLSGQDAMPMREAVLADYKAGKITVIVNAQLFIEGLDTPSTSCIILCAPTNSLTRFLQSVGRGSRPAEGKENCIVLDHAGCAMRHGLPTDDREWSLEGRIVRKRRANEPTVSIRICPKCFGAQHAGGSVCKHCGHVFEVQQREVKHVEGELQELTSAQKMRRRETGMLRTRDELEAFAKLKNYRPGWAEHVWQARQGQRKAASG